LPIGSISIVNSHMMIPCSLYWVTLIKKSYNKRI